MNIDEMIAEALEEEFEERVQQCCSDASKHKFSLAYRLWEYRALKNLGKNRRDSHWTLRRARHIVTAAIIAASSLFLGITAYAAIAIIGRFSFEEKKEYSKMFIESLSSDKTEIEEYYGLPEEDGWEVTYFYADEQQTLINYELGDKKVTFSQEVIREHTHHINTEKAAIEPISLYKENDGFVLDFGTGGCSLYWIYDGYLFELFSNFNKKDTASLAYFTKIVDFQNFF